MADQKTGAGIRLAAPFLALLVGIPLLFAVFVESQWPGYRRAASCGLTSFERVAA